MLEERGLQAIQTEGKVSEAFDYDEWRLSLADHQGSEDSAVDGDPPTPPPVQCNDIIIRDSSEVHVGNKNYFIKQFHLYDRENVEVQELSVPDLILRHKFSSKSEEVAAPTTKSKATI